MLYGFCVLAAVAASPRPSFIIFFADDMGYSQPSAVSDRSAWAGDNGTISTPNLDRFAREGVAFSNWYSAFHVCSPSRASIVTGRLPARMGIGWIGQGSNGVFTSESAGGIPSNETTIGEALEQAGYLTAAIGKWHLGQRAQYLPTQHGFGSYFGIPYSCDMGSSAWAHTPKFPLNTSTNPNTAGTACPFACRPLPLLKGSRARGLDVVEQPTNLATLAQRYADAALDFIASAKAQDKPFLLYLAWNHIHSPNFASGKFCGSSKRGPVGDAAQEMDDAIGQVMAGVDKMGLDEDTVMFFTSDNGSPLGNDCRRPPSRLPNHTLVGHTGSGNGPLRDGKFTTWEGGVREPAAVRWGNTGKLASAGTLSPELATTYDIFPTILALANVSANGGGAGTAVLDGRDLSPMLFDVDGGNGRGRSLHECIMIYHSMAGGQKGALEQTGGVAAVRCGRYKAHFWTRSSVKPPACGQKPLPAPDGDQDPPLLFDLEADIGEDHPIANTTAEYHSAMQTIRAALQGHLSSMKAVPNQMCGPRPKHQGLSECVGGSSLDYTVCKDPRSEDRHPFFPNCTSNPEYFNRSINCYAHHKTMG